MSAAGGMDCDGILSPAGLESSGLRYAARYSGRWLGPAPIAGCRPPLWGGSGDRRDSRTARLGGRRRKKLRSGGAGVSRGTTDGRRFRCSTRRRRKLHRAKRRGRARLASGGRLSGLRLVGSLTSLLLLLKVSHWWPWG